MTTHKSASKKKPEGVHVKVKRSSAGLGLFADQDIKKGDLVIEYFGEVISTDEADRRGGKYLFDISDTKVVDGKERANTARYINHACKPNCETEIKKGRIFVYAIKNIKAGEELSYDYGDEYYDEYIKPHGCKCASSTHRK